MERTKRLRILEGLGYVSAMMVAAGGILDQQVLRLVHLFGLVFAIIAIVRLMVMNIRLGESVSLFEPMGKVNAELELPDLDEFEFSEDSQQHYHDHQYQTQS